MGMSIQMSKVYDYALEKDQHLTANAFSPQKGVTVLDEEGTTFTFKSSFAEKVRCDDGIYIIVYTEHHGVHVFPEDELYGWYEFLISVPTTLTTTLTTKDQDDETEPAGTIEEVRRSPWSWLWGS